ncbi:MAG: AI-2E family transporter [Proteobacteria bacterium SG_bin9]|nr:MAG: AI-2E family transporter [Proteobacteria bacterium SG_bin9]
MAGAEAARRKDAPTVRLAADEPPPLRFSLRDIASFSIITIALIAFIAALYAGRLFFIPIVTGFVLGTMLSPAAQLLSAYRIPRTISAVLIVAGVCLALLFMIGLISAPLMDWSQRIPEIVATIKAKSHVFDRPLALWNQFREMFGETAPPTPAPTLPKIDWVQPTLEFVSPTIAQLLVFFATLVLFIASWPDMRRAAILMFPDREARLRTLRILNAIEGRLGNYLLMVTGINIGVGIATGVICAVTGMPNPAGLGALAATLNYIPIIGPIVMFVIIAIVGLISFPSIGGAIVPCALFAAVTFIEGHFVTPAIIGRRLALNALAVFLAIAFWTWIWGPMGAFLSSPILIVGLILKEHLMPDANGPLPEG